MAESFFLKFDRGMCVSLHHLFRWLDENGDGRGRQQLHRLLRRFYLPLAAYIHLFQVLPLFSKVERRDFITAFVCLFFNISVSKYAISRKKRFQADFEKNDGRFASDLDHLAGPHATK